MRRLNVAMYEALAAAGIKFPNIPVYVDDYYGQCAEDIVVRALLKAMAFRFNLDLSRERYLEIGGNHPVATSATYLLHRSFGMSGVIVEANPRLIDDLRRVRANDLVIHGAVQAHEVETVALSVSNLDELSSVDRGFVVDWAEGKVGEREQVEVPALRINQLIEEHFDGKAPLFLAVDIEGLDLDVLRDLDLSRFRPAVIQAEPSDHYLKENSRHMIEYLCDKGYALIGRTDVNLIFGDSSIWLPVERSEALDGRVPDTMLFRLQQQAREGWQAFEHVNSELADVRGKAAEMGASLEEARQEGEALRSQIEVSNSDLSAALSAAAATRHELDLKTAELRRAEFTLAEERRAHLSFRHRADDLQEILRQCTDELETRKTELETRKNELETLTEELETLKGALEEIKTAVQQEKGMRHDEMLALAREVWWERNRRTLPYKLVKALKGLAAPRKS